MSIDYIYTDAEHNQSHKFFVADVANESLDDIWWHVRDPLDLIIMWNCMVMKATKPLPMDFRNNVTSTPESVTLTCGG